MKWKRIYDGCWYALSGNVGDQRPLAILEQNHFGRRLWTVELPGQGRITDKGFDCFGFKLAKQVALNAVEKASKPYTEKDLLAAVEKLGFSAKIELLDQKVYRHQAKSMVWQISFTNPNKLPWQILIDWTKQNASRRPSGLYGFDFLICYCCDQPVGVDDTINTCLGDLRICTACEESFERFTYRDMFSLQRIRLKLCA